MKKPKIIQKSTPVKRPRPMKRRTTVIELHSKLHSRDFPRMRTLLRCVSSDATRPILHYVQVETDEDGVKITATDGKRLRSDRFSIEASPGLYEIKANTARGVFLTKSRSQMKFPNHKQVIPSLKPKDAYILKGVGSRFVLWASAALGCRLDPSMIALADHEAVTLYIQKDCPELYPAVLQNDRTTVIVMPFRVTEPWVRELDELRKAA